LKPFIRLGDRISANAKVNLFLDVVRKRSDGYHDITSVFQEISLADRLTVRKNTLNELRIDSNVPIEGNLIAKIYGLLQDRIKTGLDVGLDKRIPIGAGLGGGSSDAARFFLYLDKRYGLEMTPEERILLCRNVGSDAAFFIDGGCQTASGRGEVLERLVSKVRLFFTIVQPDFGISTAESYRGLDPGLFGKGGDRYGALCGALRSGDLEKTAANLYNIFEVQAYRKHPSLAEIRSGLISAGAMNALMTGTGSCIFGIFRTAGGARLAAKGMRKRYKKVFVATTIK
jgi:4-diphosphocytidyl-2-C-methyl-D-erythritol kinase